MHNHTNSLTIEATVITKAKTDSILKNGNGIKIKVNAIPENGEANEKIIKLLAKRLKISQKNIKIIKGLFSNKKTLLIENFTGSISELID